MAARQITEKHSEFNKHLIMVSIDVEKVYDSVKRKGTWESMENIGVR